MIQAAADDDVMSCWTWAASLCSSVWKVAWDDPRRVVHSLKVGLALAIVSLLMLLQQTYNSIGKNAIWAVMTVVVVFEFTAGATLSKGLNRALGTLVAGLLALGVSQLANSAGGMAKPIVIGIAVFTTGTFSTYLRFCPKIKARYDYGVVIFLLTFCLIVVGGSRHGDSIRTATDRLLIICIGCGIALATSLFLSPIWAGDDLHNLIATNFYNIADSLQECVRAYVEENQPTKVMGPAQSAIEEAESDAICKGYRSSLLSSQKEESLANFACWEPPHGRFRWRHPWRKYVQIGVALRHCAYSVLALHCCLRSDIQAPKHLRAIFQEDMLHVAVEAATVLREWGDCVSMMQRTKAAKEVMKPVRIAVEKLQNLVNAHAILLVDPPNYTSSIVSSGDPGLHPEERSERRSPDHENSMAEKDLNFRINITESDNKHLRSSLRTSVKMSMESARALSLATFACLLIETVSRLEYVVDAAEELAEQALFRNVSKGGLKFKETLIITLSRTNSNS